MKTEQHEVRITIKLFSKPANNKELAEVIQRVVKSIRETDEHHGILFNSDEGVDGRFYVSGTAL